MNAPLLQSAVTKVDAATNAKDLAPISPLVEVRHTMPWLGLPLIGEVLLRAHVEGA